MECPVGLPFLSPFSLGGPSVARVRPGLFSFFRLLLGLLVLLLRSGDMRIHRPHSERATGDSDERRGVFRERHSETSRAVFPAPAQVFEIKPSLFQHGEKFLRGHGLFPELDCFANSCRKW